MRYVRWLPALLLTVMAASSWAVVEFECGDGGGGGEPPLQGGINAYLVYVSYPGDGTDSTVAVSANNTISELTNWLAFASNGHQNFNLSVLRRLDFPNRAWRLGSYPDGNPTGSYIGNYGAANRDAMTRIYNRYYETYGTSVWQGVQRVFMIHYACVTSRCAPGCCAAGYGGLGFSVPSGWNFTGRGVTLMTLGTEPTDPAVPRLDGGLVHEYGHTITGLDHPPFSGNPPSYCPTCGPPDNIPFGACFGPNGNWTYVNMGGYDILRGITPFGRGLIGYHPYQMFKAGWLTEVVITDDIEGLHVPDAHSTNPQNPAKIFRVVPRNPVTGAAQAFILANHQKTGLDYRLGAGGLLIWHFLRSGDSQDFGAPLQYSGVKAWDLESAQGKFSSWAPNATAPNGPADPVSGRDRLEADWCWLGSVDDFFNDGQIDDPSPPPPQHVKTVMACDTNPNTNLYASADFSTGIPAQSVQTSIAFENIHKDPNSTDMIVDVYVTPKQKVLFPNGGQEYVASGEPWTIQWAVRPHACVVSVGISISSDNGSTYTGLASTLGNSGAYATTGPATAGTGYRVKVSSTNATPTLGEDASDASFTVWNIPAASISYSNLVVNENGTFSVVINWQTTIAANDLDELILTPPPGGSPVGTYSNYINGLNHSISFAGTCTPGIWTYVVKSRRPRFASGDPKSIATGTAKTFKITNCLEM